MEVKARHSGTNRTALRLTLLVSSPTAALTHSPNAPVPQAPRLQVAGSTADASVCRHSVGRGGHSWVGPLVGRFAKRIVAESLFADQRVIHRPRRPRNGSALKRNAPVDILRSTLESTSLSRTMASARRSRHDWSHVATSSGTIHHNAARSPARARSALRMLRMAGTVGGAAGDVNVSGSRRRHSVSRTHHIPRHPSISVTNKAAPSHRGPD